MNELVMRAKGVELATQSFGDPAHPPIILIMGGMASMLLWPEEFCRRLALRDRFVVRCDQRDSGLSTKYPPGRPGYGFGDVVGDIFRVLDGYGIAAAHVAGFSLGGIVGQGAAIASGADAFPYGDQHLANRDGHVPSSEKWRGVDGTHIG